MSTLGWFQWMHCNGQLTSWHEVLRSLESQFAPSQYYDPQGSLFTLAQESSVADHQTKFATLSNQVYGLSPQALLSCFFSGLKLTIQRELQPLQITMLSQAISLARLQEEKYWIHLHLQALVIKTPCFIWPSRQTPNKPNTLPIKKLTPSEMQFCSERGLFFNFVGKFHPCHKCKPKFLMKLS